MSQQTIGIGSAPNDGTGDPLRTAFDKANDNFDELYTSQEIDVVRDYGADPTGATDSTTEIQNALNAADDDPDGRTATVIFPYGTYQVSSTLTWRNQSNIIGCGMNSSGSQPVVRIAWNGTDGGGPLIQTEATASNWHGRMENIGLYGKHATNTANDILVLTDRMDYPGAFYNVHFNHAKRHAVTFQRGCTNFVAMHTRFDSIQGFCIVVQDNNDAGDPARNMAWIGGTWDSGATTGTSGAGQGFLLVDYGNSTGSPEAKIRFTDWELEHNATLENWLPAEGTYDKALFCIGHNSNYTENTNRINVYLTLESIHVGGTSAGASNTAMLKMGDTTDYINVVMLNTWTGGTGTVAAAFDNTTSTWEGDTDSKVNIPLGIFCPHITGTPGSAYAHSYITGSLDLVEGRLVLPTAANGGTKEGQMYYNPTDNKIYVYDSVSGWIATAALT
jgi:hypothetical protein